MSTTISQATQMIFQGQAPADLVTTVQEASAGKSADGSKAPTGTTPVVVEAGDSVSQIMAKHGLDWNNPAHREQFLKDNPQFKDKADGRNPDLIWPDEVLYIRPDQGKGGNHDGQTDQDTRPPTTPEASARAQTDAAAKKKDDADTALDQHNKNSSRPGYGRDGDEQVRAQRQEAARAATTQMHTAVQKEMEAGLDAYLKHNPKATPEDIKTEANRLRHQIQGRNPTLAGLDDATMQALGQHAVNAATARQHDPNLKLEEFDAGLIKKPGPYTDTRGPFEPNASIQKKDGTQVRTDANGWPTTQRPGGNRKAVPDGEQDSPTTGRNSVPGQGETKTKPTEGRKTGPDGEAGQTAGRPDFKSMNPVQIKAFVGSPEFQQWAKTERDRLEALHARSPEQAAQATTDLLKGLPPDAAAGLAKQLGGLFGKLARDANNNAPLSGQMKALTAALSGTADGRQIVQQIARDMVGTMSKREHLALRDSVIRDINKGNDDAVFNLSLLNALREKFVADAGSPNGTETLVRQIDSARATLIQNVNKEYHDAIASRNTKEKEFVAMLARVGHGLTDEQQKELRKKFDADPENKAIDAKEAHAAQRMAELADVAQKDLVALAGGAGPGQNHASAFVELIKNLSRNGQGVTALQLLAAARADPSAMANLSKITDLAKLERQAGIAAMAEASLQAGGDVKSGLNHLIKQLEASGKVPKDLLSGLGHLANIIDSSTGDNTSQYAAAIGKAGAWANIVTGVLAMAAAITSPTPQKYDFNIKAIAKSHKDAVDISGDVLSLLSGAMRKESAIGAQLAGLSAGVKKFGGALGVLVNSIIIIESIQNMAKAGSPNAGDIVTIVGAALGIAAFVAGATPAGPFLAIAALVVGIAGPAIKGYENEEKSINKTIHYLNQIGIDPAVSPYLARMSSDIAFLRTAGYSPQDIQTLATRHQWVFNNPNGMLGFKNLTSALKNGGLGTTQILNILNNIDDSDTRDLCQYFLAANQSTFDLSKIKDKDSLVAELERAMMKIPAGKERDAVEGILKQVKNT